MKMVDIEVYTKKKDKLRQAAPEWLPPTPFLMGISGPSMSGKGILQQNSIMEPSLYHDENEILYLMSYISGLDRQSWM